MCTLYGFVCLLLQDLKDFFVHLKHHIKSKVVVK